MPLLLLGFGVGAVAGFFVSDGVDAGGRLLKWGAIGLGGYVAARHFKVI